MSEAEADTQMTIERIRERLVQMHAKEVFSKRPDRKWLEAIRCAARTLRRLR